MEGGEKLLLRAVLDNLPDMVWVKDPAGAVLMRNPAAERVAEMAQVELSETPIRDADGKPLGVLCIARDVSNRRKLETDLQAAEQRYKTLAAGSFEGIAVVKDGVFIDANDRLLRMLGYERDQLIGRQVADCLHPEDRAMLMDRMRRGVQSTVEHKMLRADGGEICVEAHGQTIEVDGERLRLSAIRDITRQKEIEATLKASEERYRGLVESQTEFVLRLDAKRRYVFANRAYCDAVGMSPERLIGSNWGSFIHPDDAARTIAIFEKVLGNPGSRGDIECRLRLPGGGERWIAWEGTAIVDSGGVEIQAVGRDVTEERRAQEIIWRHANFDQLTGLPNRRLLRDRLEQQMKMTRRALYPLALMFIDLDRFKEVNDSLGHEQGDELLCEVARRLKECVRETDTVGRLGGDEFTVVLGNMSDTNRISAIAEKIVERLSEPYQLERGKAYIAASIGITLYPNDGDEVGELLRNADQAMYAAKRLGGKRFYYFEPPLQEAAVRRVEIANDLRSALQEEQFLVHYQPIVELASGRISKAEALIRWNHPQRGMLGPSEFIPIAEETGLISFIGEWVFRQAAQQAAAWRASRVGMIQISVNKSPVQFQESLGRESEWPDYLHSLDLKSDAIAIEITEGLLLDSSGPIRAAVSKCREYGFEMSLDDFGTGYSSLSYLKSFNINYLKIDQAFIRGLGSDPSDKALCEAIIVMAHKLGLKVIAEGVETEKQRDLLVSAGCDYAQGYLYSRPIPPAEFEKLVDAF